MNPVAPLCFILSIVLACQSDGRMESAFAFWAGLLMMFSVQVAKE